MIRRLPVIPTILVAAAVAVMIMLGFWQLDRRDEKAAMLEHYAEAQDNPDPVAWPASEAEAQDRLYRRAAIRCEQVTARSAIAGANAQGQSGLAQTATCRLPSGVEALVVLGWSQQPEGTGWQGGRVVGVIAPGPRLVADPPLAGLEANAIPDPSGIPNNHLAYAVQWFLFAGVALVIYALAVRKRLAAGGERG